MANFIRFKRRWTGAAGAPASLKSGEPAYNGLDDTLYFGFGDDGAGNATSIKVIAGLGAFMALTTDQAVAGIKTFNASPLLPTATAGDNTTKAANTAFVAAAIAAAAVNYATAAHTHTFASLTSKPTTIAGYGITDAVSSTLLGAANGVATLGADSKVTPAQLPASLAGGLNYQGVWDASTNTPALPAAAAGNKGYYWKVSVAGATSQGGITDWKIGDWVVSNGTSYDKIDNTDAVTTVAGRVGAVVLTTADVSGLGTMATQNAAAVAITGGTIDGVVIDGGTY